MPSFQEFRLPDAGEGLTEAEIVAWLVAVGDVVRVNQPLVEIETAKSLVELPSPWDGVVTEILVQPGTTVDVGTPIVRIDVDPTGGAEEARDEAVAVAQALALEAGAGIEGADKAGASGAVLVGYGVVEPGGGRRARRHPAPTPKLSEPAPGMAGPRSDNRGASDGAVHPTVLAKPPVRKLARDLGVDLTGVHATGPGGIVTREDLVEYAKAAAQPRSLATYADDDAPWLASGTVSGDGRQTRVPVKSVRKRTAEAMVASAFSAPHVTEFHTVDVTRTMKLVAALREDREFTGVRVTPLLIAAKALLLAVHRRPEINASWDAASQEIVYKHYVNLGIAAATPRGLVVPNIKDAHRLNLKGIADALADLTATARAGRTTPADMADGTITITNVGVFGIDSGTPILNPGEAAILAFGAIREQPWVHKGKIKKRWVTQLALSFDHRLVDGELGARVLADVAAVLEEPARALVWG
jgi:pyruvate dehydrogenase E2 component (dihydrolipoamide acetyltransferase)